jgi:hypothetical protein
MIGWALGLARGLLGGGAAWLPVAIIVLAVAGGLGLGWWRLEAARADAAAARAARDQAIAAEAVARAERDQARAALARGEQERTRAREAARAAEARSTTIRREVEAMRKRLATVADGRARCEGALNEIRREMGR